MYDYTQRMGGVDKSDQFMTYYNGVRRSLKWTTKLAIHLFSMCVTNAYILYTKYGDKTEKIDHEEYILKIVEYLIEEGMKTRVLKNPPERSSIGRKLRFGDHFPEQIPRKEGTKRKPSRPCFACNGSWEDMRKKFYLKDVQGYGAKYAKRCYV